MDTDPLNDRGGCLASPLARVGFGVGMLAVVLVLAVVFRMLGDDDSDAGTQSADDTDTAEATEAPDTAEDLRPAPGLRSVTLDDGQTLDIELFVAPTAEMTIIAAPSRNADRTSITPVGEALVAGDCANVVAFDAQSVDASPISLYQALFEMLMNGDFGPIFGDGYGTLGASFTSLPSWQAARDNGADYNFVFAPSDPFPDDTPPADVPMSFLFIGEGDTGFLPVFEQWRGAGFTGATIAAPEHGSALFTGAAGDEAVGTLQQALCF